MKNLSTVLNESLAVNEKSNAAVVKTAVKFYNDTLKLMDRNIDDLNDLTDVLVAYDALLQSYGMSGLPLATINGIQKDRSFHLGKFLFDEDSVPYAIQELDKSIDDETAYALADEVVKKASNKIKWW